MRSPLLFLATKIDMIMMQAFIISFFPPSANYSACILLQFFLLMVRTSAVLN